MKRTVLGPHTLRSETDAAPQAAAPAVASPRERSTRSPLPSGGDIIFLAILYLLLGVRANSLFDDASTGWHLVTGQYVIAHLQLPRNDLISYTFAAKPWVPFEWFFDVAAAALVNVGGLPLLAVAAASGIALLFLLLFQDVRREGCAFLTALALTLVGALASSVHWLARPHLFTFFGVYIFARVLEAFHRGKRSGWTTAAVLGVTTLVWSNAHPGFLIGFAMIVIYIAGEAITAAVLPRGVERASALRRARILLSALAVAAAASAINPSGLGLYPAFAANLRQLGGNVVTEEFQSPTFHGELYSTSLALLFGAFVLGLAASSRRPWLGRFLLVLAFAALALNGARNVPLFVIVSLPVIAELLAGSNFLLLTGRAADAHAGWVDTWLRVWRRIDRGYSRMEWRCTMHLAPMVAVAALAVSCVAAGRVPGVHALIKSSFDPRQVPTTTLAYIRDHGLPWDRGFNLDNWGGYIRFETGERVFIDDRAAPFYPRDFFQDYMQTLSAWPVWPTVLDRHRIQWVLVSKTVPLATVLRQSANWKLRAEDPAAYLFVRAAR